jgi:CHAT domain-containing protein
MKLGRALAPVLLGLLLAAEGAGEECPGLKECEAQFVAHPRAEAPAKCLFDLSRKPACPTAAVRRLRNLLAQNPKAPWLSFYLGSAQWESLDEAERLYRTAAGWFALEGEARGEYRARANLYDRLAKKGNVEEARREAKRAILVARASGQGDLLLRAQILEARVILDSGQDLGRARQLLTAIKVPDGDLRLKKDWLEIAGNTSLELGRSDEAQESFQSLAALAAQTGDRYKIAAAQYGLLRVLTERAAELPSDFGGEELLAQAHEALSAATGDANKEFRTRFILGMLTGGTEEKEHFARCVEKAGNRAERYYCYGGQARKLAERDPRQAQEFLDKALEEAKQSADPWLGPQFAGDQMRVSWRTEPRERAIADSWAALNAVEALRRAQGPASRAGLFSTWSDDYYWFSGRLLDLPDRSPQEIAEAFDVTERLRFRTGTERLAAARPEPSSRELLSARLQHLKVAIAHAELRASAPDLPPSEGENARQDLAAFAAERREVERLLPSAAPAASGDRTRFASLQKLRDALAADEALLSYQVAPRQDWTGDFGGGAWLMVVTRAVPPRAYPLLGREPLRHLVGDLLQPLEAYTRDHREAEHVGQLYKVLLARALDDLPRDIRRLVVIPDDDLHKVPFAALRPTSRDQPLVSRYAITLAPSATVWLDWRLHRPRRAAVPALALADPVGVGDNLPPLPRSAAEGKVVVGAMGDGSVLRLREEASAEFLKNTDLRRFGVIHLAAHSVIDDEDPERSAVRLSPVAREDGHLDIGKIVNLKMDGQVVVLSTCRSASGKVLRGEGVMSLARAFFLARAHTVVGSLWPIEDQDAESLFTAFYDHLGEGASVAGALAAAQRNRIAAGAPLRAWAGLVVLGDGDLVPLPGGRPHRLLSAWAWALLGAALLAALLAVLWRRARGRELRALGDERPQGPVAVAEREPAPVAVGRRGIPVGEGAAEAGDGDRRLVEQHHGAAERADDRAREAARRKRAVALLALEGAFGHDRVGPTLSQRPGRGVSRDGALDATVEERHGPGGGGSDDRGDPVPGAQDHVPRRDHAPPSPLHHHQEAAGGEAQLSHLAAVERRVLLDPQLEQEGLVGLVPRLGAQQVALEKRLIDRLLAQEVGECIGGETGGEERQHQLVVLRHLEDEDDAGERRADDRREESAHADHGEGCRGTDRARPRGMPEEADEQSGLGTDDQKGGEDPARRAGAVAQHGHEEAQEEEAGERGERPAGGERRLDQPAAATEELGGEPAGGPDPHPDQGGRQPERPARRPVEQPKASEEAPVEGDAQEPGDQAQHEEERQAGERRDGGAGDPKDRLLPEEEPGDHVCADRGDEGRGQGARGEVAAELLEHEDHPGERRVERRGEARPGAGGNQGVTLARRRAQEAAHHLADRPAHLDGRSLAPEGEAGAEPQDAARVLDEQHPPPSHAAQAVEDRLDMGNAAPRGLRRKPPDEAEGDPGGETAGADGEAEAQGRRQAVRQPEERIAAAVASLESEAERGGQETGQDTDQGRARRQPAAAFVAAGDVPDLALDVARGETFPRLDRWCYGHTGWGDGPLYLSGGHWERVNPGCHRRNDSCPRWRR